MARAAVSVVAFAVLAAVAACRREAAAPAPSPTKANAPQAAQPAPRAAPRRERPRLPEDPVLGKQSEQQWREHLRHEEEERQMWFDLKRLDQHRALTKLIAASRARYDHARTEAAVAKVRAEMPRTLAEIRKRVTKIDHWGNNSRLLPDYDALSTLLAGAYADARIAAIKGDPAGLEQVRAGFDQRMQHIEHWLTEVASESEEGEAHEERERGASSQRLPNTPR